MNAGRFTSSTAHLGPHGLARCQQQCGLTSHACLPSAPAARPGPRPAGAAAARGGGRAAEATPARRSPGWRGELEAAAPSGAAGPAPEWAGLGPEQDALLGALQGGAVARRLPILNIQHGPGPADAIGMPVAAWLLGECLLHWAARWRAAEARPRARAT